MALQSGSRAFQPSLTDANTPGQRPKLYVTNDTASKACSFVKYIFHNNKMSTTPDATKVFNEKLNGRLAMLGLTIGLATEFLTGKGILQQVFGFFS